MTCPQCSLRQAVTTDAKDAPDLAPEVMTIRGDRARPRRTVSSTAPTAPTSADEPADRRAGAAPGTP